MSRKTSTEVVIDGKVYKLGGYEETEYLQRVAAFINDKISELGSFGDFRHLPAASQAILVQLNIADDYFKANERIRQMEARLEEKDKYLYDLKHDLSAAQIRAEKDKAEIEKLRQENENLQKMLQNVHQ